jgi:formylglycine-generating enzyme required for sulfatase activity
VVITWEDARKYCQWIGGRLPTEAEWERAARGGVNGKRFPWGETFAPRQAGRRFANLADESAARKDPALDFVPGYDDTFVETAPVASFAPTTWGLYDIAGNVWEWTADWYGTYSVFGETDPRGAGWGNQRVTRGGSWYRGLDYARASQRLAPSPDAGAIDQGVRCALDKLFEPPRS